MPTGIWIVLGLSLLVACTPATHEGSPPSSAAAPARAAPARVELDGEVLYASYCRDCHQAGGVVKAPSRLSMAQLSTAALVFAMSNGKMKSQAQGLNIEQQIALAEYLAGERTVVVASRDDRCADGAIDLTPRVSQWGMNSARSAYLGSEATGVRSANVASLQLDWAYGLPQVADARSQPVITADTLFLATTAGQLLALDRFSGCLKWRRDVDVSPRTALTLGTLPPGGPGAGDHGEARRSVLFYGDISAHVNAVDALTGEHLWRQPVGVAEQSMLTGAIVQHEDRLVVPISLYEVPLARNPEYVCCRAHGAVRLLDASNGETVWTLHLTEDATLQGMTDAGIERYGPSGVPVWSTPTVDALRGLIYVGTGQNASAPATENSDSVLAIALDSGEIVWRFQAMAGDVYNGGCSTFPRGPNCPDFPGPDFDIGASVVMAHNSGGQPLLLVGQKSGDVYALDPENNGRMLWQTRVGSGSALGGVHWGIATHDGILIATAADPDFPLPGYFPRPGVYALDVDDGSLLWKFESERGCETDAASYFGRTVLYPECPFYHGFSAAPAIVNDLVFAASLDGKVRAFELRTGELAWQYDTLRGFDTVNGVQAHGGSIDVAAVLAVGEMVYLQSGYSVFGQLPGNVLLAFAVSDLGSRTGQRTTAGATEGNGSRIDSGQLLLDGTANSDVVQTSDAIQQ